MRSATRGAAQSAPARERRRAGDAPRFGFLARGGVQLSACRKSGATQGIGFECAEPLGHRADISFMLLKRIPPTGTERMLAATGFSEAEVRINNRFRRSRFIYSANSSTYRLTTRSNAFSNVRLQPGNEFTLLVPRGSQRSDIAAAVRFSDSVVPQR